MKLTIEDNINLSDNQKIWLMNYLASADNDLEDVQIKQSDWSEDDVYLHSWIEGKLYSYLIDIKGQAIGLDDE